MAIDDEVIDLDRYDGAAVFAYVWSVTPVSSLMQETFAEEFPDRRPYESDFAMAARKAL